MANRLTMAEIDKILTLHTTEHSNREIADLLGINRETVGKYVARAKAQNQPNAPHGSTARIGRRRSGPSQRVRALPRRRSWRRSSKASRPIESIRTWSKTTAKAPPAITVCGGLWHG